MNNNNNFSKIITNKVKNQIHFNSSKMLLFKKKTKQ